jgi:hypothetical protein
MSDLQKSHSPLEAIWQWCRGWSGSRSGLEDCGDEALARMAHDVGVSGAELCKLASRGSQSAELLLRRMAALDLDRNEVARTERATFQDLQRVCTLCQCQKRCARDLMRSPGDAVWKDYCPNAQTLTALNALPWMTRREW